MTEWTIDVRVSVTSSAVGYEVQSRARTFIDGREMDDDEAVPLEVVAAIRDTLAALDEQLAVSMMVAMTEAEAEA